MKRVRPSLSRIIASAIMYWCADVHTAMAEELLDGIQDDLRDMGITGAERQAKDLFQPGGQLFHLRKKNRICDSFHGYPISLPGIPCHHPDG